MKPRINFFTQVTSFYSIAWHSDYDLTPSHISLYFFLLNQNNRNSWAEWFKVPMDLGLKGSFIGSKRTYYSTLEDLSKWGFLRYEKGVNEWKAPKISITPLKSSDKVVPIMETVVVTNVTSECTSNNTTTAPLSEPQLIPLPTPQQHRDIDYKTNTIHKTIRQGGKIGTEEDTKEFFEKMGLKYEPKV